MGKRANGEGSIYRQSPDGRWVAAITMPDGKTKRFYFKTQKEAREKLTEVRRDVQRGLSIPEGRMTVERFLHEWLRTIEPSIRPTTCTRYQLDVRRIVERFGRRRLTEITPQMAQDFLNAPHAEGLSAASVRHCHTVMRAAFRHAENMNLIARNPVGEKRVKLPRVAKQPVEALTIEQARALLQAFRGHPLETLVTTALGTGLREGELLGLRWEDVDLEAATLTVRHQMQRLKGGRVLAEPKSRDSRATIPLVPLVVESLKQQRDRQIEMRLAAGSRWEEGGFVFPSPVGTPLEASNVYHRFQKHLRDAGLPTMRVHDLRHGTATLLHWLGVDIRTIQAIMRHSQISVTAITYTHVGAAISRDTLERLNAAMVGRAVAP